MYLIGRYSIDQSKLEQFCLKFYAITRNYYCALLAIYSDRAKLILLAKPLRVNPLRLLQNLHVERIQDRCTRLPAPLRIEPSINELDTSNITTICRLCGLCQAISVTTRPRYTGVTDWIDKRTTQRECHSVAPLGTRQKKRRRLRLRLLR